MCWCMDAGLERLLTEIRTAVGGIAEEELHERHDISREALLRQLRYLEEKDMIEKREEDLATYWEAVDDE